MLASTATLFTGTPVENDPFFNQTSLLLKTAGLAGATNQSFYDDSSGNLSVTAFGNVTQGSVSPYIPTGYWSNYFDGTGDYLSLAPTSALTLGTGDFTIEMWINPSASQSSILYDSRPNLTNGAYPTLYLDAMVPTYVANGAFVIAGGSVTAGTWNHIAVSRSSGTTRLFLNGSQVGSNYSDSTNYLNPADRPLIGGHGYRITDSGFNGYMSNVRVLKGTALYTAAFTPPTEPLAAITNTSLLTCQDNRFLDRSANNFTITAVGNTSITRLSPFNTTIATSAPPPSTTGGVYFDGSGDYLSIADNAALDIPGDFTLEFWINPGSGNAASAGIVGHRPPEGWANGTDWVVRLQTGTTQVGFGYAEDGSFWDMGTYTVGVWSHHAITRSGTTVRTFKNGVQVTSTTSSSTWSSSHPFLIGRNISGGYDYKGYISNLRLVKGTALYTATFTPPTSTLTAVSGTSLLTCQSSAGIVDASTNNFTVTSNGNVSATAVAPSTLKPPSPLVYGGSAYFDGSGDYINVVGSGSDLKMGSGDWTFECWVFLEAYNAANSTLYCDRSGNDYSGGVIVVTSSGTIWTLFNNGFGSWGVNYTTNGTVPIGRWTHIAVTRQGSTNTWRTFINGGLDIQSTGSGNPTQSGTVTLGRDNGFSQGDFKGWISNARVVKGAAVYSAGFTPPTSPVTAISGTSMLLNFDNAVIYDATGRSSLVGPASPPTVASPPDTDAVSFPSNYLSAIGSEGLGLGGNFTVEFWWKPTTLTGYQTPFDKGYNAAGALVLQTGPGDGKLTATMNGSPVVTASTAVTAGAWNHVALVRNGTTVTIYINGTSAGTGSSSANLSHSNPIVVGANGPYSTGSIGQYPINGSLRDVRVTNGVARYTANFTAPSRPFPVR